MRNIIIFVVLFLCLSIPQNGIGYELNFFPDGTYFHNFPFGEAYNDHSLMCSVDANTVNLHCVVVNRDCRIEVVDDPDLGAFSAIYMQYNGSTGWDIYSQTIGHGWHWLMFWPY